MAQTLAQLVDEITVDAYDTDEQLSGFLQVFQDEVTTPTSATVLGVAVEVVAFDLEGDERRGLVARCRHPGATKRSLPRRRPLRAGLGRRMAPRHLPDLALSSPIPRPAAGGVGLARTMK